MFLKHIMIFKILRVHATNDNIYLNHLQIGGVAGLKIMHPSFPILGPRKRSGLMQVKAYRKKISHLLT